VSKLALMADGHEERTRSALFLSCSDRLVGAVAETRSPGGGAAETTIVGSAESAVVGSTESTVAGAASAVSVSVGRSAGGVSTVGGVATVSVSISVGGAGGGVGSVGAVVGLALVLNGGPVAVLVSLVLDDLHAAVGQQHAVLAGHVVAVAALLVAEVVAGSLVLDVVLELVLGGLLKTTIFVSISCKYCTFLDYFRDEFQIDFCNCCGWCFR
jgi:hypothetical protein